MGFLSRLFDPAGPLEAPAPQAQPSHFSEAEETLEKLRALHSNLVNEINQSGDSLPTVGIALARRVTDGLAAILASATAKTLDIYALMNVENIMKDYLPSTLRTYVAAAKTGAPATEKLVEQLHLLLTTVEETLIALRQNDAQALEVQHRFIQTKFTGSDLAS